MPAPGMHSGLATDDAMNLAMSAKALPLYEAVKKFIAEEVEPMTEQFYALGEGRADRWSYAPGQLELLESVKAKAKAQGLWNFFLPNTFPSSILYLIQDSSKGRLRKPYVLPYFSVSSEWRNRHVS
jgi:hypothetical protein